MAWRGSFSRSLLSAAAVRSSATRSVPRRLRLPSSTPSGVNSRRFSLSNPRTLGELGCSQSLMPLLSTGSGVRLTSHLSVNLRGCCDLFNGN